MIQGSGHWEIEKLCLKNRATVDYMYKTRTWEAGAGGWLQTQGQFELHSELHANLGYRMISCWDRGAKGENDRRMLGRWFSREESLVHKLRTQVQITSIHVSSQAWQQVHACNPSAMRWRQEEQ